MVLILGPRFPTAVKVLFTLYLSLSTRQAAPKLWELLGHRAYMLSIDDVDSGNRMNLEGLRGLELMLDSGAFRRLSKGRELEPTEVLRKQRALAESLGALPIVYDYPLNPLKASREEYERSNLKTLNNVKLWSKCFGTSFLPVIHAMDEGTLLRYLKIYERMGFEKVALGSLALLSRYRPREVLKLVKEASDVFGKIHVLGVGNSLALALAHLGIADSVDSSSHLQDARYGMVRHPLSMSMVVVTERITSKRKEREEVITSSCDCPACSVGGLGEWGREGFLKRSIHNAYWVLRALHDRELAERIISRRRSLWKAYKELLESVEAS